MLIQVRQGAGTLGHAKWGRRQGRLVPTVAGRPIKGGSGLGPRWPRTHQSVDREAVGGERDNAAVGGEGKQGQSKMLAGHCDAQHRSLRHTTSILHAP